MHASTIATDAVATQLPARGDTALRSAMGPRDALDLLPLRQAVTATGDAARAFARQVLLDQLSRPQRYHIVGHGRGGQILAASERALAEARAMLRQAYGDDLGFGRATVCTYRDARSGATMVPVIFVRIDAPRAQGQELQQLLLQRGARLGEVNMQRNRIVIRGEVQLPHALDLEAAVDRITDGAAQVLSWLLRYEAAAALDAGGCSAPS